MRRVVRRALPTATARALRRASDALLAALARGENPSIGSSYKSGGIQKVLKDQMFEGCCCFCEAPTEATNYGQVEHYKPKARAEFRKHAYVWENLLWACGRCNGPKADNWNPSAPLLDPTIDEPALHLEWNDAALRHLSARGEYTIDLLDLNGQHNVPRYELRRDHLEAARLLYAAARDDMDSTRRDRAIRLLRSWVGPGGAYRGMLTATGIDAATVE